MNVPFTSHLPSTCQLGSTDKSVLRCFNGLVTMTWSNLAHGHKNHKSFTTSKTLDKQDSAIEPNDRCERHIKEPDLSPFRLAI